MKTIGINFLSHQLYTYTDYQQGIEYFALPKSVLSDFIPSKYEHNNFFLWNFDDNTMSIAQDTESVIDFEYIQPTTILPFPNLVQRYDEFLKVIGYEDVSGLDLLEEIEKSDFPEALKQIFRNTFLGPESDE